MIEPIIFFDLVSADRKSVSIRLTGKAGPGRVEMLTRSESGINAIRSPGKIYCAPFRDFEVIKSILPSDVLLSEIPRKEIEDQYGIRVFTPEMDLPEPPELKAVNILALDLFQGHPKVMRKAEKELRALRLGLLKKKVPCTLSVACSVNSATYQAYHMSHFECFERQPFPLSITQLKRNNLLISMEGASAKMSAIWPGMKKISA